MRRQMMVVMVAGVCALLGCQRQPDPVQTLHTEANATAQADAQTRLRTEPAPADHDPIGPRDAYPRNLLVVGTEPFWTVKVGGAALEFVTPETIDQPRQMVGRREISGNALQLRGGEGDGAYTLEVTAQPCSDGMSDLEYAYTATFVLGEQRYSGCARDPAIAVPAP